MFKSTRLTTLSIGRLCCRVTVNIRGVYHGVTISDLSNPICRNLAAEAYICMQTCMPQKPCPRMFMAAPLVISQTGNNPNVR